MRGAISSSFENEGGLLTIDELNDRRTKISTNTKAILLFIAYLIIGLLFYVYAEGISALDTIYLAVITFATVGYGDIPVGNRVFTTFYVLLGAGIVGAYFGIFSNDVMEAQEQVLQRRLVTATLSMNEMVTSTTKQLKDYQLEKLNKYLGDLETKEKEDAESLSTYTKIKRSMSKMVVEKLNEENLLKMKNMSMAIYEDELREIRAKGAVDFLFLVIALLSGAVGMVMIEGWSFSDALYWASVTATTTGYGDVVPDTDSGKLFTIFYTIIACSLAAKGFRDVVTYPMVVRAKDNEARISQQFGEELSERTLKSILKNDFFERIPNLRRSDKEIVKSEFVLLILQMMNKVNEKDLLLASKIFDRLDTQCDGVLNEDVQKDQILKARQRDVERNLEQQRREQELADHRAKMTGINKMLYEATETVNKIGVATVGFVDDVVTGAHIGGSKHAGRRMSNAEEMTEDGAASPNRRASRRESSRSRKNSQDSKDGGDIEMAVGLESSPNKSAMKTESFSTPSAKDAKKSKKQVHYSKVADEIEQVDEDDDTVLVNRKSNEAVNPMITSQALDDHAQFLMGDTTLPTDLPTTPPPRKPSSTLPAGELSQRSSLNLQSPLK